MRMKSRLGTFSMADPVERCAYDECHAGRWYPFQRLHFPFETPSESIRPSISIDGDTLFVGNGAGAVAIYRLMAKRRNKVVPLNKNATPRLSGPCRLEWRLTQIVRSFESKMDKDVGSDGFGMSVSVRGRVAAIGSPLDCKKGSLVGACYLFELVESSDPEGRDDGKGNEESLYNEDLSDATGHRYKESGHRWHGEAKTTKKETGVNRFSEERNSSTGFSEMDKEHANRQTVPPRERTRHSISSKSASSSKIANKKKKDRVFAQERLMGASQRRHTTSDGSRGSSLSKSDDGGRNEKGRSPMLDFCVCCCCREADATSAHESYKKTPSSEWRMVQKIYAPNNRTMYFGWSLAINSNMLFVGDPGARTDGAVHVFRRKANDELWTFSETLTDPDAYEGENFGAGGIDYKDGVLVAGSNAIMHPHSEFVDVNFCGGPGRVVVWSLRDN
jgi:hypothetical protein